MARGKPSTNLLRGGLLIRCICASSSLRQVYKNSTTVAALHRLQISNNAHAKYYLLLTQQQYYCCCAALTAACQVLNTHRQNLHPKEDEDEKLYITLAARGKPSTKLPRGRPLSRCACSVSSAAHATTSRNISQNGLQKPQHLSR